MKYEMNGEDARGGARTERHRTARVIDDRGGVSVIAGIAALTIGVVAAAGIVVGVMMDHARSVPGPNGPGGAAVISGSE